MKLLCLSGLAGRNLDNRLQHLAATLSHYTGWLVEAQNYWSVSQIGSRFIS